MTLTLPDAAPLLSGSLRELALADVLQLLELGRKSGVLHVHAADGRVGALVLGDGALAGVRPLGAPSPDDARDDARDDAHDDALRDAACALLDVRAGTFTFVPLADGDAPTPRLRVEALLVDAARRVDEWARLAPHISGPDAVPTLAEHDAAPVASSPLGDDPRDDFRPDARHWALLAEVDGVRAIAALAAALGRDALAVAADCHALARAGLVRCHAGGPDAHASGRA